MSNSPLSAPPDSTSRITAQAAAPAHSTSSSKESFLARNSAILRIAFGVAWGIDATLKWLPGFRSGFAGDIRAAADGQPHCLAWFFDLSTQTLNSAPTFFAVLVAILETLVALALLVGFRKRITYVVGGLLALLIWTVAEGFGGPYTSGATDIGTGIIYALVSWALILLDWHAPSAWSLDRLFTRDPAHPTRDL